MSRLGRTEKIIFSIAMLVLVTLSYFLYDDSLLFSKNQNDKLELIGDVATSQNDVRRKNLDTFSWLPASRSDSIFQNDSIFTGDRSEALIRLKDGSQIHIEPNSLITLNFKNGQMNLDLRYGNLVSEITQGSTLVIKSGNEELKLEGSQGGTEKPKIRLNKARSGAVGLKLVAGKAQVSDKTKAAKTELKKEVPVAVSPRGEIKNVEPAKIQVLNSAAENLKVRLNSTDPVSFDWTSKGEISRYEFELSQQPDFKSPIVSKSLTENNFQLKDSLDDGEYFWRIKGFKDGEIAALSDAQKIKFKTLQPPVVTNPQASSEINLEVQAKGREPLVTTAEIKWQGSADYKSYTYQISQDANFSKILSQGQAATLSALTPHLQTGSYWVRVSGQYGQQSSAWSQVVPFKITLVAKKAPPLGKPVLVTQKINFKVPAERSPASVVGPAMEWKPVSQSQKYKLQISKDLQFSQAETYEVPNTKLTWQQFTHGMSYYRVFAIGKNGEISEPSQVGTIQVELPSPVLSPLKPIHKEGVNFTSSEVTLSWSEVATATSYLLQLDKDGTFKNPQTFEFQGQKGQVTLTAPGSYKVRVQALDSKKAPVSDFSKIENLNYTFRAMLTSPVPLEPLNGVSIFLQQTTTPSIWVEWKKAKNADVYRIEVSDKADFSHILIATTVTTNHFLIKDKVPLGKLYWRVRAQTKDESQISSWTDTREFTLHHQKGETF